MAAMTKTEAARILARHVLSEAVERGVQAIDEKFARDVIAEGRLLGGTRWALVAAAAEVNPAYSRVRTEARKILQEAKVQ